MAQFPSLPLFTDAYLADTTHLTTLEHGAYLLLLMAAWRSDGCRLPNDDKRLARYCKMNKAQWNRVKDNVLEFWKEENGFLYQGRLTDELQYVIQVSKKNSENAKARWLKNNKTTDAIAMPDGCQTDAPTPTPTPTKKTKEKKGVQISQDWALEDKNIEYALEKGFLNGQILELGESFKDYWLADATPKGKKKDWDAAWRTWVRNAIKFGGGNNNEIGERFR